MWHGRTKLYDNVKYKVIKAGTTKGKWAVGDTFEIKKSISYDNIFVVAFSGKNVGYKFSVEGIDDKESVAEPVFDVEFERFSQINEVSYYGSLVIRVPVTIALSIVLHTSMKLAGTTALLRMTTLQTAGLVLKATRNFSRLDQLRIWLEAGIPVRRLHPDGQSAYGR